MIHAFVHYASRLRGGDAADAGRADLQHRKSPAGRRSAVDSAGLPDVNFVVFDTELTGLNAKKDSIVSIGAVKMHGERILLGEMFYGQVDPRTALTARSVIIHGITPTEASASPGIDDLLPQFLEFCDDALMVGHVVSIDLQFLNWEMKELYGRPLRNRAVDTYKLYEWVKGRKEDRCAYHGGSPEPGDLFSIAETYNIPVQNAHNALGDAFITAQVLQRLLGELPQWGIRTVDDLLRIGSP
jgi:DNA polymerase III subunit epsilon